MLRWSLQILRYKIREQIGCSGELGINVWYNWYVSPFLIELKVKVTIVALGVCNQFRHLTLQWSKSLIKLNTLYLSFLIALASIFASIPYFFYFPFCPSWKSFSLKPVCDQREASHKISAQSVRLFCRR